MDSEWIRAVAAVLLGQIVLICADWARHLISRNQRRQDARDDFQKQTLVELQETLYQLVRALSNSLREYKLVAERMPPPDWPAKEDPRIIGAGVFARIDALTERVDDVEVRELVGRYLAKHEEMFSGPVDSDVETVETHLKALREAQIHANKRIGELLRKL